MSPDAESVSSPTELLARREFWNALEGRAVERFAGQNREPDFDLVEPGRMRRRVMETHVLVPLQPHVAFGFVGGEIVEDDMDFSRRMSSDDMVHEVQELDAPSPFVVFADDCPAGEIEHRAALRAHVAARYRRREECTDGTLEQRENRTPDQPTKSPQASHGWSRKH